MDEQKLPLEMTNVLTTSHFVYLCTTDLTNQPHITPMFFVFDEKTNNFYVMTFSESKKMKNIHNNPKISLTIDIRDAVNPFNNRGVMIQGKATVHFALDSLSALNDKTLMLVYANFKKKYPVLQKEQSTAGDEYKKFSESLLRITPDRMIYWRGPKFIRINFNKQD